MHENLELTTKGGNKMKKTRKLLKNQKGLTLIELLAVIVILAIVAAIAVPAVGNIINNSRDKAILSEASSILAGAKLAAAEGVCDPLATPSTCDQTNLNENYVEGITDGETTTSYSVSKTESGPWSVTYSKFSEIKNTEKFPVSSNTVTACLRLSASA